MIYILYILISKQTIIKKNDKLKTFHNRKSTNMTSYKSYNFLWIIALLPLLSLTLLVTGIMTLLQSILPLDIANGGIIRPPLTEESVATLVTLKLVLIAIFQWPIGYILRNKNSSFKFILCLILLLIGFIFLSLSSFLINGYVLILIAFIPIIIAICIFLPSASDAIIKSSPVKYHGSAIALYSQCFGISSLTIPWMAGKLIDNYNTAFPLWLIVSMLCILFLPICKSIK